MPNRNVRNGRDPAGEKGPYGKGPLHTGKVPYGKAPKQAGNPELAGTLLKSRVLAAGPLAEKAPHGEYPQIRGSRD